MPFSFGNLLTILIVFLVLALYRRLDRQNRSLEKVKRYSDNVVKNLGTLVEEKTSEVRDLSIELQVNLKTGKEILKRIREVEAGLRERAGEIDGIGGRISEYDRVLKELVDMTSRVEENLKRVREESLFVDKVGRRIQESVTRLATVEKEIPELQERLTRENQESLDRMRQEVGRELEDRVAAALEEMQGSEKKVRDFSTYITRLEARREELQKESIAALRKSFEEFDLEARGKRSLLIEGITTQLNSLTAEAVKKVQRQQGVFEEVARRAETLETEVFSALRERIGKDALEVTGRCQALEGQLKSVKTFSGELGQRIQEVRTQFEELRQQATSRLEEASREVEALVFQRVESRLAEYEGEVEYRFHKLEEVNVDVEALEGNLRQAMEKMTVRLQKEFEAFGRIMDERYGEEKGKAEEGFAALHGRMEELEKGLQELKSRAYQTVSEQLQVFEDDFFADLKKKNQSMAERVQEWQTGLDNRIMEITQVQTAAREALEKTYQEQMKEGLDKVRQNLGTDLKRIETQVNELQAGTRQSITSTEGLLKEFEGTLRQEVDKIQKEAQDLFQFELGRLREDLNNQLKKFERELADRLREISSDLSSGRKGLDEQFETTRTEAAIWQTKLLQLMKEAENGFSEKLSAYRLEAESSIASIREAFAGQRQDLIVATEEERVGLKNELKEIGDRVAELERELNLKAESSLKGFQRDQEHFQMEFKRGVRDLQVEMEGKVRDIRSFIGEMKERAEEQQRVIFGRIDEGAKVLNVNLGDIEKRLKVFITQTRIFERADSLRITMEGRIDELKSALKEVQVQRKDVQDIGSHLLSTKKMMEDVQGKLNRFLAERRRIEDMDSDFKRLLSISKDVDLRVESLQSSQDALQEIQAKIRDMESLEKVIETRYDRLEKKKSILDSTTEGVDRSFQMLENLEKMVKSMEGDIQNFSRQAVQLQREIEVLTSNREKADTVVQKLGTLDGVLNNLEGRIEKFETSREWLARTETRFEQVSREAQEQVQLLQSILKKEASGQEKERDAGAPPLSKRDQVIKLAHQGWSSKEIAKVTKLSRGEVELILELAPRN